MRILHVVHQYPPDDIGGVELNTRALAEIQAQQGHEVTIFYRRSAEDVGMARREEAGVTVYAASSGPVEPTRRFFATWREPALDGQFRRVVEAARPEIVHIQHLMGLPTSLVRTLRERQLPYLITLHDYWWSCANAQLLTNDRNERCEGPDRWINCGRCALARAGRKRVDWLAPALAPLFAARQRRLHRIAEAAHYLIAPTGFTRDIYRRMGLPGERIRIVPHGIIGPVRGANTPVRREHATLQIVYVGGLSHQKGVHVLIEAVNGLADRELSLTIYGDPDTFPDYVKGLRESAGHPGITFAGPIPNADLLETLEKADVLVVPSIWFETAALVIQEAFAAGLPVIASDLGALRERVRDGVDGLLVPPGDSAALREALRRLIDEPRLLAQLRAGIRPVRTMEEQARETEALYLQALSA